MKKETLVRVDWKLVWREWSTRLWALAIFIGTLNETQPDLVQQITMGLPEQYVQGFTALLAFAGFVAKFAPQPLLRQKKEAKVQEAKRHGVVSE